MARRELGPSSLAIVQAVEPWLDQAAEAQALILLAVSGGADSLAMAAAAAAVNRRRRRSRRPEVALAAVVVDHGLQPDSAQIASRAADQLAPYGITAIIERVTVCLDSGDGLEGAARDARRRAFAAVADQLAHTESGLRPVWLLLAHTLDDQAESVLLGLARGSGIRSLAGISSISPLGSHQLVRPLLGIRRRQTEAACAEWQLQPWHDPHNDDPRFLRVQVRQRLLPMLRQVLGDQIDLNLARTAALAAADADLLDALAAQTFQTGQAGVTSSSELDLAQLADEPALRSRQLLLWLRGHQLPVVHSHLEAVTSLVDSWRGQGPIDLPGGQVGRRGDQLWVRRTDSGCER